MGEILKWLVRRLPAWLIVLGLALVISLIIFAGYVIEWSDGGFWFGPPCPGMTQSVPKSTPVACPEWKTMTFLLRTQSGVLNLKRHWPRQSHQQSSCLELCLPLIATSITYTFGGVRAAPDQNGTSLRPASGTGGAPWST